MKRLFTISRSLILKHSLLIAVYMLSGNITLAQSDNCNAATSPLATTGSCYTLNELENGNEGNAITCGAGTTFSDGWARFVGDGNTQTIQITSTNRDVTYSVYIGCPTNVVTDAIACLAVAAGGTGSFTFPTVNGTTYLIRIQRRNGTTNQDLTSDFCIWPTLSMCAGSFTDPGGAGGNYANSTTMIRTICPSSGSDYLTIDFSQFNIEELVAGFFGNVGDYMDVYLGSTIDINNYVTTFTGNFAGGVGAITAPSPGQCMTFVFGADGSVNASGWLSALTCTSSLPNTSSDCDGRVNICENASFQITPNGIGVPEISGPTFATALGGAFPNNNYDHTVSNPEITTASVVGTGNSGCLLAGERNSTWMLINVQTGGTLEFTMGNYTASGNYYDWALWPYSPTACDNIANNSLAPVRCNWNGQPYSYTGMSTAAHMATIETTNGNTAIDWNFAPELNVGNQTQYLLCLSNYSNTTTGLPLDFIGTAVISCTTLDVDLLYFNGANEGRSNVLKWTTISEKNNAYFEIERSIDGKNWLSIGKETGNGTSTQLNNYSMTDNSYEKTINYYRLSQVDFDGKRTYHNVVLIDNDESKQVVEIINLLGQQVDTSYKGLVIYLYSNGSSEKKMQ